MVAFSIYLEKMHRWARTVVVPSPKMPLTTVRSPPASTVLPASMTPPTQMLPMARTVKPVSTSPLMFTSPRNLMLPVEKSTSPSISSTGLTWKLRPVNSTWPDTEATSASSSSLSSVLRPFGSGTDLPLLAGISCPSTVQPGSPSVGRIRRQISCPSFTLWIRFRAA